MVAWLPTLGGCLAASQVARYDALALSVAEGVPVPVADPASDPFTGVEALSREGLIAEVLLRNPTVESARQAWRETLARYPQVTALADPSVTYETAPGTIASEHGYGQVVRLSQRFEWPGKQALRGAIVLAEAEARGADLERARLHLAMTASILFDDHYVVRRALEINREHVSLVTRLQQSAQAQYGAGLGSQQDPLQADVELALVERERLALVARQQVIAAQINGLLHRAPTSALPPAPATLVAATMPVGSASEWAERATLERPEMQATTHRIDAARSGVALAERAYMPDFSVAGTYNSMWPQLEHQFMFGLSLNIPIQIGARVGGVEEASAALARARAVHAGQLDGVRVEVREAWVRLEEAIAQVALYRDRILPASRQQVAAAEAGYQSGRDSFSDIMAAERRLRSFEGEYEEALANTWRGRAVLARATSVAPQPQAGGGAL
jgi:outer membrane protein TolC